MPSTRTCRPVVTRLESILVPSMELKVQPQDANSEDFEDASLELLEWLGMLSLQSPRLSSTDAINPYLCRYDLKERDGTTVSPVMKITWRGFFPAKWIHELYLECM